MVFLRRIVLLAALLAAPALRAADETWSKLKPGMTPAETAKALGTSLFSSRGRGFEIGIYEGKAEVVFLRDQLVAWTSPVGQPAAPTPPMTAFQFNQQWRPLPAARVFNAPSAPVYERRRGSFLPAYRL
jgi:hypothetical protein